MDVEELKRLAGIDKEPSMGENLSLTGTKKAEYQRKHKIQPGTAEWFKLWFARPNRTGDNPMPKSGFIYIDITTILLLYLLLL